MASGIVRAAIIVVLENKRLVSSPLSDHEIELFDLFCQRLSEDIGRILEI